MHRERHMCLLHMTVRQMSPWWYRRHTCVCKSYTVYYACIKQTRVSLLPTNLDKDNEWKGWWSSTRLMATSSVPKGDVSHRTKPPILVVLLLMAEIRLTHQLRLVVYPIIHRVLLHSRWFFGISSINSMFVFGGLLNLKKGSMVFFPVPSAKVISLITFSASSNRAGIGPFGACGAATDFTLGSHTTGCYCWKKSQTATWLVLETLLIMGIFTIYQLILQDFFQINSIIQLIPASSDLAAAASNTYLS